MVDVMAEAIFCLTHHFRAFDAVDVLPNFAEKSAIP